MLILYSIVRSLVSPKAGFLADEKGNAWILSVALSVTSVAFFVNMFTRPGLGKYLYIAYYVLFAVAEAGINGPMTNITYDYIDDRSFSDALGARNAIGGVTGFLASLLGGAIVSAVQAGGNRLFGVTVYAQQLLSGVSCVILACVALYLRFVMVRLPKIDPNA